MNSQREDTDDNRRVHQWHCHNPARRHRSTSREYIDATGRTGRTLPADTGSRLYTANHMHARYYNEIVCKIPINPQRNRAKLHIVSVWCFKFKSNQIYFAQE